MGGAGTGTQVVLTDFVVNFRQNFPEFSNAVKYPASMIDFWYEMGDLQMSVERWGDRRTYGLYLFCAHNIVLATMNSEDAAAGADPGMSSGLASSESAGPLSHSMDTGSITEQDGGSYNETRYGRQLLRLIRLVGTGGIQV